MFLHILTYSRAALFGRRGLSGGRILMLQHPGSKPSSLFRNPGLWFRFRVCGLGFRIGRAGG